MLKNLIILLISFALSTEAAYLSQARGTGMHFRLGSRQGYQTLRRDVFRPFMNTRQNLRIRSTGNNGDNSNANDEAGPSSTYSPQSTTEPLFFSRSDLSAIHEYRSALASKTTPASTGLSSALLNQIPDFMRLHEICVSAIRALPKDKKEDFKAFSQTLANIVSQSLYGGSFKDYEVVGYAANSQKDIQIIMFMRENQFIILCPGTKSIKNVVLDFEDSPTNLPFDGDASGEGDDDVPKGFKIAADSVSQTFLNQFSLVLSRRNVDEISMFGYSLGGAVLQIILRRLLYHDIFALNFNKIVLITFGCPDMGTAQFTARWKSLLTTANNEAQENGKSVKVVNFAHTDDVVTIGTFFSYNIMRDFRPAPGSHIYLADPDSEDFTHHLLVSDKPNTGYFHSFQTFLRKGQQL